MFDTTSQQHLKQMTQFGKIGQSLLAMPARILTLNDVKENLYPLCMISQLF